MPRLLAAILAVVAWPAFAATPVPISYVDARVVLEALAANLPPDLRGRSASDIESSWSRWVERRRADVRTRLARGDDDSIVNLWMYGTRFTRHPTAAGGGDAVLQPRLDDFLAALAAPGADERLQFAAAVVRSRGLDPATAEGRRGIAEYLGRVRRRMIDEFAAMDRALASVKAGPDAGARAGAYASVFRERGLSSDTSLLADYGVSVAIDVLRAQRILEAGTVRRVAIAGPGLDFTNKADGYDFYPQQSIQPFALIDTLRRTGLAVEDLSVATFDVNPRVNAHLQRAVAGAGAGERYRVTLPLDGNERWSPGLLTFWSELGRRIGEETPPPAPPAAAGSVRVRSVLVSPAVVRSIAPHELNVVYERLEPQTPAQGFDLIVATNLLVYYDVFEQALALANVAAMLRPGGVFLTNNAAFPTPPLEATAGYQAVTYSDRQYDEFFWYRRQR
jgi:hypothetical protein